MSTERQRHPAAPTISEVAAAAGVGRATVARTLGNYGSVSDVTRARVMLAAERLGYQPNTLARSMTTGITKTLGIVLADVGNPFFSGVLRAIAETAKGSGYDAIVLSTNENLELERDAIRVLLAKQVDGLVVASAAGRGDDVSHLAAAVDRGTPMVLIDRLVDSLEVDSVVIDNRDAARRAVGSMIAQGHRRIAFAWGPVTLSPATDLDQMHRILDRALWSDGERLRGYLDALEEAGLPFDTALVTHVLKNEDQATRAVNGMLALADPPTAIFTTETEATVGALRAIRSRNLHMPAEISLIGFDDSPWAAVMDPPLTMIEQPMRHLGETAAAQILRRIEGDESPAERHIAPSRLISRSSDGPAPRT
ncbi:LacI family DNA-binding transcriptional regulator [Arthrobacter sp. MSA 4-2]|uniref:LacI family DNA-binding transcriptional regulator n=1 Tax=Arthrobacter sp. MSA 4-2 TaxID=2794349 RepID=UPI0018E875EA|nr:LacI family DNA-binding transcriptional regulator [Arthrobacter sp. MSA 4-2]MBJ2121841.1 LacI family DNA-binding transcriptional regulator [Arthrobacter sp. MSA 4-2]